MFLNEKESKVLSYLRNPSAIMRENHSPVTVNDLSNEEIVSLYNKMDAIIENEGNIKRSLGNFDEMYVLELSGIKNFLLKEIHSRGLGTSTNDGTSENRRKTTVCSLFRYIRRKR